MLASWLYFLKRFEEGCGYSERQDARGAVNSHAGQGLPRGPGREGHQLDGRLTEESFQ